VPPAVALLNYISSGILGGFFAKLDFSRGFFCKEKNKKRITKIKVQKTIKRIKHKSKDVWSH
jgi:hypothetical protein